MIQTPRINWIDWAKFFGIFLVVLGHVHSHAMMTIYIYSFHMPLFFALSGLTFRPRPVMEEIKVSARRLLVPYAVFYAIGYCYWFANGFVVHPERFEPNIIVGGVIKPLIGFFLGIGVDVTPSFSFANAPVWFLVGLFSLRVTASSFYSLVQKCKTLQAHEGVAHLVFMLICVLIVYFLNQFSILLPFSLGPVLIVMPFFLVAYRFKQWVLGFQTMSATKRLLCASALFVGLYFMAQHNGSVDVNTVKCGSNLLFFYVNSFVGTIAFMLLSSLFSFEQKGIVGLWGRNTITILGMHRCFLGILCVVLPKVLSRGEVFVGRDARLDFLYNYSDTNWPLILVAVLAMFLSLVPCYIFERWFPRLIGK